MIDKIDFTGLEQIPDSLRRICVSFSFLKVGKRYRRVDVEAEIQRILNLLYDNGYQNAYVERVGIRVLIDSTKKIVSVFVPFNPNERYLIKDIKILVEGTGKMKVSEELVRREIEFKEGEFYSRSLILKSEANLSQTGLFENVRINLEPTGKADTVNLADVNVWVVPRNKHDIFPSIYFSDERNAFNVGVSVDYQNRNFLGGGRNFSSSVRFQIQSLSFNRMPSLEDTTSAGLIETNMRLNQPYLVGRRIPGEFSLALMIDKQKGYLLNIARNRVRFIYKPNGAYSGFLDWDIESVNIKFRGTVDPKLEKLYQRQLNSILSITFQIDRTDDLIYPRSGYAHMISVEEGGVVPFLLGQMGINVLPFSQYYKFGWLYRRFFGLNNSVFAFKFKLGVANEFYIKSSKRFELQPIPINRRFFAGGSASVRGWRVRELGNVSNPALGGNVLIEANFENRIIFWRSFGGVVFVDLGNLWDDLRYVKLNQFAVDFRAFVRDLAKIFKTRIELWQIGVRDEARKIGGIGSCGRALCCNTWLEKFNKVTLIHAKFQNLPLNPIKLSGQCGRLKCCLLFEMETYLEALKNFPPIDYEIQTERGIGKIEKFDIFKNYVYVHYGNDLWERYTLDEIKKIVPPEAFERNKEIFSNGLG